MSRIVINVPEETKIEVNKLFPQGSTSQVLRPMIDLLLGIQKRGPKNALLCLWRNPAGAEKALIDYIKGVDKDGSREA